MIKTMFAGSTLALGILLAAQSVQAATVLDGDANPASVQAVGRGVVHAYVAPRSSNPWDAFAAIVAPKPQMPVGVDGDNNPIAGGR